jgi:hypothetical protein
MNGNIPRNGDGRALTQAEKLLLLIEQRCASFEGASYYPNRTTEHISVGRERFEVLVGGGGDASILRSFERKGWIEWVPQLGKYACRITDLGKAKAQEIV